MASPAARNSRSSEGSGRPIRRSGPASSDSSGLFLSDSTVATATTAASSGSAPPFPPQASRSHGGFSAIAGVLFRCFGSPEAREDPADGSDVFRHQLATPSRLTTSSSSQSSHGHSTLSSGNRSFAGLYSPTPKSLAEREPGSTMFTIAQILKATKNFSPSMNVGQGGSGTVYKGQLDDGTMIAVKRARKNAFEREMSLEFQNEIDTLRCIEHLNLVRFYGFLNHMDEKLIIVEYVPNGTLRDHLDGLKGKPIEFPLRLDIAIDVAHAVAYLHNYSVQPIIHRDIKSSNILITNNHRAKVSDFGFAKRTTSDASHVSTQVKGTAGYLDPEYLKSYQLTDKSDVYSFGVLLVEIVTGRRPIELRRPVMERLTPKWVMEMYVQGRAAETLDPNLEATEAINFAVQKIFELAFHCLAPMRKRRPSMRRCAEVLWTIRKDYKEIRS